MKRNLRLISIGLLCLTGIALGWIALNNLRDASRFKQEKKWIRTAVQQLERTAPPPLIEPNSDSDSPSWITSSHLVFSNGWAAYRLHSIHEDNKLSDMALLRLADGTFYFSKQHFCQGISGNMLPRDPERPQPADTNDFLQNFAKLQEWNLFSPDGQLSSVILSHRRGWSKSSKSLWVWIGKSDGTNETTLFERRYPIKGFYVSWHTRWESTNALTVEVFDYGPGLTPFMYFPKILPIHRIAEYKLRRDAQTGRFTDSN